MAPPAPPSIQQTDWNIHKAETLDLFPTLTQKELLEHLKNKHGFCPTPAQYERQKKKWGLLKTVTREEWVYIEKVTQKRKRDNKETEIVTKPDTSDEAPHGITVSTPPPAEVGGCADNYLEIPFAHFETLLELCMDQYRQNMLAASAFANGAVFGHIGFNESLTSPWDLEDGWLPQALQSNGSLQSADMQFNDQNSLFQPFQQEKFGLQGKRLLGEILNEILEPNSPEYDEKIASRLRNITVERRKGDFEHHVKQLSQASGIEQPFHLLRGNFWVIEVLVALRTPTTSTFASALLNSAVRLGKSGIAHNLLQKDIKPKFATDIPRDISYFALEEAVRARNVALVRLLVQRGAEGSSTSWRALLLHKSSNCSDEDYWENVQFVIDNTENVNEKWGFGFGDCWTLLSNVIETGDLKAAHMVLQAGARVNKISRHYATPLQAAAGYGNAEMVELLIKAGADIDAPMGASYTSYTNALGEDFMCKRVCSLLTPLQIALAKGQTAVAEILLQHGADVNGFDASAYCGESAMQAAPHFCKYENEAFVRNHPPQFWQDDPWYAYYECRQVGLLDSPVQAAARKGDFALAGRLLSLGANIHARGGFGTAIQVAASRKGNLELVKYFLDQGADINAPAHDPVGRTALQAAIQYGDIETTHFLLESGVYVNADPCTTGGRTALQAAVHRDDVILAKVLILLGANVNAKAPLFNGLTCLQAASKRGNMQMIDLLLKHGADANAPPSERRGGMTALQAAVAGKHTQAVQKLLDHGGDPNMIDSTPEDDCEYPLCASIFTHQHEMTKLLLENGADPNITDSQGPLAFAIQLQEAPTVQLLIAHGADVNPVNSLYGPDADSMLQIAATEGSLFICRLLIEAGADLGGSMGTAALHSAVKSEQYAIIQFLLSEGVSPNWENGPRPESNVNLCSPLSETFWGPCDYFECPAHDLIMAMEEIAEILLNHGAKFDFDDRLGNSICHVSLHVIRRLIEAGLDINGTYESYRGESLLQHASRKGMTSVVQLLLTAGAAVDKLPVESDGHTALQGAVKGQHIRVAELLLSNGADVNGPPSDRGFTALQQAVIVGSLPLVHLLLKWGANVNALSAETEETALEVAAGYGRLDIAHLLLKEDKELDTLQTRCMEAAELALLNGFPILADVLQEWKGPNGAAHSDAMPPPWTA